MSVDDLVAKADSRLTAAARDLEAGDVERSLSASYCAMFYAASAVHRRPEGSATIPPPRGRCARLGAGREPELMARLSRNGRPPASPGA